VGKPYQAELQQLAATYEWSSTAPVGGLCEFVSSSCGTPLIAVGSGGSYSSATFAAALHACTGRLAKAVTPLALRERPGLARHATTLILSGSGRNPDVQAAIQVAIASETKQLLALCMRTGGPISRWLEKYGLATVAEYDLPCGKDGFVATNSLLATCMLLARAHASVFQKQVQPRTLDELTGGEQLSYSVSGSHLERKTWVILHGYWGEAAAVDLESKLTEAALTNVQVADYRNFAHGRHNWLAKRSDESLLVAFVTPHDQQVAKRTLDAIPKSMPVIHLETKHVESWGALALLVQAMRLVGLAGESCGIDPGRPKVAQFGRRIYHLRAKVGTQPITRRRGLSSRAETAIRRKTNGILIEADRLEYWLQEYRTFVRRLERTTFSAVVLDYDGTLCTAEERHAQPSKRIARGLTRLLRAGILVGIATGRGKSVRQSLVKVVPKKYLRQVVVGYYNGGDIGLLDREDLPQKSGPLDESLREVLLAFKDCDLLQSIATVEDRPRQLTIEPQSAFEHHYVKSLARALVARFEVSGVRFVESAHSMDVLAPGVSKLRLIEACRGRLGQERAAVLCIGDMGNWPGNDFELLATPYSLSVSDVSAAPDSCWNLGTAGRRGVDITLEYFDWIQPDDCSRPPTRFRIKVDRK